MVFRFLLSIHVVDIRYEIIPVFIPGGVQNVTLTIPGRAIHAHAGKDLNLDCLVSEPQLSYFIRNKYV